MESKDIFSFLDEMRKADTPEDIISQRINSYLREKARMTDTPYHGHFELTPLCNLDCKMCYVHLDKEHLRERNLLPAEEWESLIQQAIDAGMAKATLSGGECLTYPWFERVFLFLKSRGIVTAVLTNGVLLNRERIRFFQEHMPLKIQVSLYGSCDDVYESVTGSRVYATVVENIKAAKEAGLPIKISITPSKYMLGDVKNVIRLAKELEVPYAINLGLMTPRSDTGRECGEHDISIDDYVDIMMFNRALNNKKLKPQETIRQPSIKGSGYVTEGLKCGAGRSTFSINWLGVMNPCTQMTSIAAEPLKVGFQHSWEAINAEVKGFPRFTDCNACAYSHACDFCAAENEKLGSRFKLSPRWCARTWKMVENGLRLPDPQCD